jgi:hypothetical protein
MSQCRHCDRQQWQVTEGWVDNGRTVCNECASTHIRELLDLEAEAPVFVQLRSLLTELGLPDSDEHRARIGLLLRIVLQRRFPNQTIEIA